MDENETEVARILLELSRLVYESELDNRFSFTWGAKRRRSSSSSSPYSASASTPSGVDTNIPTTLPPVRFPSLPSPPPPPAVPEPSSALAVSCEKPKALSPSTPLLFSPSESDDKSKHSKRKVCLKRKREECLQMIDKLTESKQLFQQEIKNVQRHYDQLKELNLKLKARKDMITSLGLQKDTHHIRFSCSNPALKSPHPTTTTSQFDVQCHQQQNHQHQSLFTPFMVDQTAQYPYNCQSVVPFMVNDDVVGPRGIPDLNVSLDESSFELESEQQRNLAMDDKIGTKALAAQARQRRIQICRSKNPNVAASKLRFPIYRL